MLHVFQIERNGKIFTIIVFINQSRLTFFLDEYILLKVKYAKITQILNKHWGLQPNTIETFPIFIHFFLYISLISWIRNQFANQNMYYVVVTNEQIHSRTKVLILWCTVHNSTIHSTQITNTTNTKWQIGSVLILFSSIFHQKI